MNIDKSPAEIRVEMLRKDVTQAEIARELGVNPATVSRVIDGLITSDRIRRAIAKKIGIDVRFLWPSTYVVNQNAGKKGRPFSGPNS